MIFLTERRSAWRPADAAAIHHRERAFVSRRDGAQPPGRSDLEHAPEHVIEVPGIGPVLRVVAVYGANASGKSNLITALQTAALLVLLGTPPGQQIRVVPFKLDLESPSRPCRFEYEIWSDGVRWSYGFASDLLRGAGTGVEHIEVYDPKKEGKDSEGSGLGLAAVFAARGEQASPKLRFLHTSDGDGGGVFLEEHEESDGTRRLVELAPNWFLLEKTNITLAIDELDRSLHTLLSRNLLERFLATDPASSGQLIFTTHDTNLLDLEFLPQDSIRFVEKDRDGSTRLYSLAEFKPEQLEQLGNEIERGYLRGRFGGTPFLSHPRLSSGTKKNAS